MSLADVQRLAASRYVSFTTYRRDGTAVATPVWVVWDGSHLLVWTGNSTGKAKRLRHTATVTLAPSTFRGRPRGKAVPGIARFLPDTALARVHRLLAAKYRIGWPAVRLLNRTARLATRRPPTRDEVVVEITLA